MGYRILKKLIDAKRKSKEELLDMAEVYYKAGKLTDGEYGEIRAGIEKVLKPEG